MMRKRKLKGGRLRKVLLHKKDGTFQFYRIREKNLKKKYAWMPEISAYEKIRKVTPELKVFWFKNVVTGPDGGGHGGYDISIRLVVKWEKDLGDFQKATAEYFRDMWGGKYIHLKFGSGQPFIDANRETCFYSDADDDDGLGDLDFINGGSPVPKMYRRDYAGYLNAYGFEVQI